MTKCAKCNFVINDGSLPIAGRHADPDECFRLVKAEIDRLRARGNTYRQRVQILAERLRLSRTTDRIALEFWENTVDIIGAENDRLRAALIQIRHAMLRVGNGLNWAYGETTDLLAESVNIAHKALRD